MPAHACAFGPLVTMDEAVAGGLTTDQVRQRVRSGRWESLGRGRYLCSACLSDLQGWDLVNRRAALAAVSAAGTRSGAVIGFRSAALVHGQPLIARPARVTDLILAPGEHRGSREQIRWRMGRLAPDEFVTAGEIDHSLRGVSARAHITTAARTWFDCARSGPLSEALAIGDALLRRSPATSADLLAITERNAHVRNAVRAAAALPYLSGERETALESASYAGFVTWDMPLPLMQVVLHDERGFVARVDFLWPEHRLVGEADGLRKYLDRGTLIAEKRREDRIRRLGYRVVRWTWDELLDGELRSHLAASLCAAA